MGVAEAIDSPAAVAAVRADGPRAALVHGAATSIHSTIASRPAPFEGSIRRRLVEASQARIDDRRWAAAWREGLELSLEAAAAIALG